LAFSQPFKLFNLPNEYLFYQFVQITDSESLSDCETLCDQCNGTCNAEGKDGDHMQEIAS